MTDNEIIKALECCCEPKQMGCTHCSVSYECIQGELNIGALVIDLINRQKAEIERLNELLERENEKYVIAMTALKEANEEKAKLSKAIEESNEYFSEGDFTKGLAIVIGLSNTFAKLPHSSLCETETYEGR